MRFTQVTLLFALSTAAAAAPIEKRWFGGNWWQNSNQADSLVDFIKRYPWPGMGPLPGPPAGTPSGAPFGAPSDGSFIPSLPDSQSVSDQCNLANAVLPQAPKPLPPPSAGLTLYHVALGRGTQNYTCDTTNSTAAPVAVGAVASLFNATCMAATSGSVLSTVAPTALDLPMPAMNSNNNQPLYGDLSGHHYFIDDSTPYFNLHTDETNYGQGPFKKLNATAAPADAPKGQADLGYGAVAWLKLASKDASGCAFQEVFRVNTAGGNPPPTCAGQPASFEVQYSAEYWFYTK